jgi:hypothetical protein
MGWMLIGHVQPGSDVDTEPSPSAVEDALTMSVHPADYFFGGIPFG